MFSSAQTRSLDRESPDYLHMGHVHAATNIQGQMWLKVGPAETAKRWVSPAQRRSPFLLLGPVSKGVAGHENKAAEMYEAATPDFRVAASQNKVPADSQVEDSLRPMAPSGMRPMQAVMSRPGAHFAANL